MKWKKSGWRSFLGGEMVYQYGAGVKPMYEQQEDEHGHENGVGHEPNHGQHDH